MHCERVESTGVGVKEIRPKYCWKEIGGAHVCTSMTCGRNAMYNIPLESYCQHLSNGILSVSVQQDCTDISGKQ